MRTAHGEFNTATVPTTTNEGVELYYEVTGIESSGEGGPGGEGDTVAFVNDAGFGAWQWGWQYRHLAGPYRTIAWDLRGTGRSDTPDGPYDVELLTSDLEAVLEASDASSVHLVGAGLGGMVALQYTQLHHRAETVTVFGTPPSGTAVAESALRELHAPRETVDELHAVLDGAFSEQFRRERPDLLDQLCEWRQTEDASESGFEAQVAAMCESDVGPLYEITTPTLVIHGLDDPVVPVDAGRELADGLPRGTFEAAAGRRLCYIEHSQAVTDRVLTFLDNSATTE